MSKPVEIGVRAFRENLSRYIAQVREGGSVTIVSHGRPVARLSPPLPPETRGVPRFGGLKGKVRVSEDWDEWPTDVLGAFEAGIDPDPPAAKP